MEVVFNLVSNEYCIKFKRRKENPAGLYHCNKLCQHLFPDSCLCRIEISSAMKCNTFWQVLFNLKHKHLCMYNLVMTLYQ